MTTAIRLYRTYILSTFVPLNTIRRVSGVFSFLREKRKIVKFTDFHQQILRQLMEIRTNVVRLSGVRLANKNQQDFRYFANENALSANERKKRAKFLLMDKAVVTLLIRSFRGSQETIAHYLYALSYYIIAVTGGGCFERTEISFIPFQGRIQRSVAITYPFEEQPDSTRQIHGRSR